jgi:preprotein translocase subunit SecD
VEKKLGPAYPAAQALSAPPDLSSDPATAAALQPFASLSAAEVAVLPPAIQFAVPYVTCAHLNGRAAGTIQQPGTQAVACDQSSKYLLDTAKVVGTDVANAQATTDPQTGQWVVNLSFSGSGQDKWTNLPEEAYGNGAQTQIAMVLDNQVVSAPATDGVISGDTQISGSFTQAQASLLADQLKFGALPLTFQQRQIGFTLTLAGIASFIVSLGVAADSFVIYFERLKDEIRDGRTPRSAVTRAWTRARRTIVSANAITILAAIVLYLVSVGTVKGFAFALGMATLLDLMVVFLFRHPVMTLFAGTRAFLSPRVSGLGRIAASRRVATRTMEV